MYIDDSIKSAPQQPFPDSKESFLVAPFTTAVKIEGKARCAVNKSTPYCP